MGWWIWDPTYVLILPALFFAIYAQSQVRGAFEKYSKQRAASGYRGVEVARSLLQAAGLDDVHVERTSQPLGDHYDPRAGVVRLSPQVYQGDSVAALGIAAHEVGHVMQHHTGYVPLNMRNNLVPIAGLGSSAAFPLFFMGFFFNSQSLMDVGIILFGLAVLFHVMTLPVERNASTRALALLEARGFITSQETVPVRRVLNAASLTYLAATAMAVLQLLRLLVLRGHRR